jgi:hypothetical protein
LAVRDGDWKLVMTADRGRVELHDLRRDRAEAADVSREHPDLVARLATLALDWKATLPTAPDPACLSKQPLPDKRTGRTGNTRAAVVPVTRSAP